jgi:hypothetical protein
LEDVGAAAEQGENRGIMTLMRLSEQSKNLKWITASLLEELKRQQEKVVGVKGTERL